MNECTEALSLPIQLPQSNSLPGRPVTKYFTQLLLYFEFRLLKMYGNVFALWLCKYLHHSLILPLAYKA